MTTEEKAKRYDEAIEIAKEINNEQRSQPFNVMTRVFPELKVSEDEKIRKELLNHLKEASYGKTLVVSTLDYKRWADWLEKSGENHIVDNNEMVKPADIVEPFDEYEGLTDFEEALADICNGWIGQEIGWKEYIKYNADILYKIAIKKFNSVQDVPFDQKPAWSEEDECYMSECIGAIATKDGWSFEEKRKTKHWLNSLKDRVQSSSQQEWSEEDEDYINDLIKYFSQNERLKNTKEDIVIWLKSLKP